MNRENKEYMVVTQRSDTYVCPEQIEAELVSKVEHFQYLESVVTADARCTTEMKRRIVITKTVFRKLAHLLTNSRLEYRQEREP